MRRAFLVRISLVMALTLGWLVPFNPSGTAAVQATNIVDVTGDLPTSLIANDVGTHIVLRHETSGAGHDNNVSWGELGHDSRDSVYRTPDGPVPTGTAVTLRLRAASDDLTAATLRLYNDRTNAQSFLDMSLVADDGTYEWWEAQVPASADPTVYWYRFIAIDGTDTDYYEDDSLRTGGWGEAFDESVDNSWQLTVYDPLYQTPDWVKNAVFYQIFPDRFKDGDPGNNLPAGTFFYNEPGGTITRSLGTDWNTVVCDPRAAGGCAGTYSKNFYGGDLQGLIDKLDYLQDLGITAIYLNPIFESPSNHKYDTRDYSVIDDNFGDLATFTTLTDELAARNMHLVLDGVFNHVSSDSIYFDRYSQYTSIGACESETSPYRDWFYFTDVPAGTGECVSSAGTPLGATYESWFGFDSLPKLQANSTEVRDLIWAQGTNSIAPYWIDQGASGWRLDVGGDVDPGTTNDPTNDYWEGFNTALREVYTATYIVGEEWGNASSWTLGGEWDATMNYQYSTAMLGFWRDEPFIDNDHNSGSSAGIIEPLMPSQLDERLHNWQERYSPEAYYAMMNLLGSHDTSRALFMLDHNTDLNNMSLYENPNYNWSDAINRLKGVTILQFTLPGAPTIYYGDEVGLVGPVGYYGGKWEDDPYNRQPFPWLDESGTPFYTHLQSEAGQNNLRAYYQMMITARNAHPALRTGSFDTLLINDPLLVYAYGRKLAGTDAAVVVLNRHNVAHDVVLELGGYLPVGLQLVDVLDANQLYTIDGNGNLMITVPPMSGAVLVTTSAFAEPPVPVTDLVVTDEASQSITLGWTGVPSATEYAVYRSLLGGGGYEWISDTVSTTFTDSGLINGTEYFYVVVSIDGTTGLESGYSNEASGIPHYLIGWANLQFPFEITHIVGITPTVTIYGRVWIDGITNLDGAAPGLLAQVGFGPTGSAPATWLDWNDAIFNIDIDNNDEFMGTLTPEDTGEFWYLYRYSTTNGRDWVYADRNGLFSGVTTPPNPGLLHVQASGDTTAPAVPQNLRVASQSASFVELEWDTVADTDLHAYDLYRSVISSTVGTRVARILAPDTNYVDADVSSGVTYYYVIQSLDENFNFSDYSNQVEAMPEPRMVQVQLNVTVPAYTPVGAPVYFTRDINPDGTIGGWTPSGTALQPASTNTYTATLQILEGAQIEFKFARGTWETVEKGSAFEEINNRQLLVEYGSTGVQPVDLTVQHWRDPLVSAYTPLADATDVPVNSSVVVYWSKPMLNTTSFEVSGPAGAVTGTFTYNNSDYSVTFVPDEPLQMGVTYTVTVENQVDQALGAGDGQDVQQVPFEWSFTTNVEMLFLPFISR